MDWTRDFMQKYLCIYIIMSMEIILKQYILRP